MQIRVLIFQRGMRVEFLPPYSPDYNPIELAFSAIKSYMRQCGEELRGAMSATGNNEEVFLLLSELVYSVTSDDAEGWFHHCGYELPQFIDEE